MSEFKLKVKTGSGYNNAIKAYENYKKKIDDVGGKLIGDYKGRGEKTLIEWQGITFNMSPKNFIVQTVKRFNDLKLKCCENGDKLIRITKKENSVIYVEIETFDGGVVEISSNNYGQFVRSRKRFLDKIKEKNLEYKPPYVGSKEEIKINFGCGHGFTSTTPINFLDKRNVGNGCVICSKELTSKNLKEKKLKRLGSFADNNPELLSIWSEKNTISPFEIGSNSHKNIWWKCEKGHIDYQQSPHAKIGQNQGCPRCKISKGEKAICEYLEELNLEYETQFVIGNKKWRYDIYIKKHNLIIEVHGLQHYEDVDYFKGRTLEEEQENDRLKEEYARNNGYNYMIVDYKEHNTDITLKRFKKQFEVLTTNR